MQTSQLPITDTVNEIRESSIGRQEINVQANLINQPPPSSQRRRVKQYASLFSVQYSEYFKSTYIYAPFFVSLTIGLPSRHNGNDNRAKGGVYGIFIAIFVVVRSALVTCLL